MKAYTIVFMIVISFAQVSYAEDVDTAQSPDTTPTISVKDAVYSFDTMLEGEKVVHTFVVENTGGSPLKIGEIKSTCGCTSTEYTEGEIAPGDRGEVTLQLDTKGYGGKEITKSATVYSNDPKSKGVELTMVGKVAVFADVSPKTIKLFGAPGEEIRAVVEIVPSKDYPFRIVGKPETGKDFYRCTIEEKNGKYVLTAENLTTKDGIYLDTVVLKTDYPEKPEIKISVFGNIKTKNPS